MCEGHNYIQAYSWATAAGAVTIIYQYVVILQYDVVQYNSIHLL